MFVEMLIIRIPTLLLSGKVCTLTRMLEMCVKVTRFVFQGAHIGWLQCTFRVLSRISMWERWGKLPWVVG